MNKSYDGIGLTDRVTRFAFAGLALSSSRLTTDSPVGNGLLPGAAARSQGLGGETDAIVRLNSRACKEVEIELCEGGGVER